MNREELIKLIEDNGLTLHGDIEHFAALVADHIYAKYLEQPTPRLTGTFSITAAGKFKCTGCTWECDCDKCQAKYKRWKEAFDAQQKQHEEKNT